jgi:small subunit ribosomal protein S3
MGQKISVALFRAKKRLSNVTNNSSIPSQLQKSVWFAGKGKYSQLLIDDVQIRKYIIEKLSNAGLAQVVIRRYFRKVEITLFSTKPGIIIGKSGSSIKLLKSDLINKFKLPKDLKLEILEYKDPFSSALVIGTEISEALKKGVPFRRLAKIYIEKIKYSGVMGAKISIKGRLNGAEIARKEDFAFGSIPRHTIDSNIDYSLVESLTKAGIVGVKVWLYKGDKIKNYSY